MGLNRENAHLLDAGDTVIGNLISPLGLNGSWNGNQVILNPVPNPDRIIDLTAESKSGQMVTIALTAFCAPVAPSNAFPQSTFFPYIGGPATARIEFGNGAQYSAVEVDVPVTINPATYNNPNFPTSYQQGGPLSPEGGTLVTLPGGVLRVYGRNDSNLITPSLQYAGTGFGIPVIFGGPFNGTLNIPRGVGPWWNGFTDTSFPALTPDQTIPVPVSMKATVVYYTRPTGVLNRNTKTIWIYNSLPGNAANIETGGGGPAIYMIPAFAKSVRVWRNETDANGTINGPVCDVTLSFYDSLLYQGMPMEQFKIAAGANGGDFELPMTAVAIGIKTGTAAITSCALVFEIGV